MVSRVVSSWYSQVDSNYLQVTFRCSGCGQVVSTTVARPGTGLSSETHCTGDSMVVIVIGVNKLPEQIEQNAVGPLKIKAGESVEITEGEALYVGEGKEPVKRVNVVQARRIKPC